MDENSKSEEEEPDWGLDLPQFAPVIQGAIWAPEDDEWSDYGSAPENRSYQQLFTNYNNFDSTWLCDHGYSSG